MNVPEHLWRFHTRAAIDALAARFGLRNEPDMQDWEWEVADPNRIEEFLGTYESGELTEDERFVLMETIIQSFDESEHPLTGNPLWERILSHLEGNIAQLADELNTLSVFSESEIEHFSTASFACRENARWEFDAEKGWCHYNGYSTRDGELGKPEVFAAMKAFLTELEQPPPA